jgi:2-polyprenyl-6-methoxyphenol hydroxylase-like FAD-dependent oxidoreductase
VSTRVITGSRVAVVGGSIAGCAAAIALSRAGCDVTVYERSLGDLADRGFGIGLPLGLHEELISAGYLDASTPCVRYQERSWLAAAGGPGTVRQLARQPFPTACENWAVLWRALRARVPPGSYQAGTSVTAVEPGAAGVVVTTAHGRQQFDLVLGADGYRSLVRRHVSPRSEPVPAGYAIWRGSYPERLLSGSAIRMLERDAGFFYFENGHAGGYLIPDPADARGRLVNCAMYLVPPRRLDDLALIPPGRVDGALMDVFNRAVAYHLPRRWAEVMSMVGPQRMSVQPVYDTTADRYALDSLALAGDAGAVARPHTASGATTALQDALTLERCSQQFGSWEEALTRYDRERCAAGNAQTELGRRLGTALVLRTPDWSAMRPEDFPAWWSAVLTGQKMLYE